MATINYFSNLAAAIVYVLIAWWTFQTVESELPFLRHLFRDVEFSTHVLAVFLIWMVFTIQTTVKDSLGNLLGWIVVLLVLAPTVVAAIYLESPTERQRVLGVFLAVFGGFWLSFAMRAPVSKNTLFSPLSESAARVVLVGISLLLLAYVLSVTPPRLGGVKWSEIYSYRSSFRTLGTRDVLYAYAFNWESKVVGPILLAFGLQRRAWLFFTWGAVVQIMLFTISGEKTILFSPIVAAALTVVPSKVKNANAGPAVIGVTAIVLLSRFVTYITGRVDTFVVIALRFLQVQGLNTMYWIEFFSLNPRTRWANGLLGFFWEYPYDSAPGFVIGGFLGRANANVNANFLGDGYGAFGVAGALLSVAIMCFYLYLLRAIASRVGNGIVLVGSLGVLFSAANSGSFYMLLGGGGLFALLILSSLPNQNGEP